ncbi:DUF1194 domain-containing protein [Taklimakanibacter deserti]|uniref:DUF1194 domain-containing protein n=1 Tax=Taklimakanibacter deserti TaxID=2267839 RepID=UPI000E6519C7
MRRTAFRLLGAAFAVAVSSLAAVAADTPVDLELVLAVDVSRSMDIDEQTLQRNGYVAAFRHKDVIEAISSGPSGRIAVSYVEWAGPAFQTTLMPWTIIDGEASARAFADRLAAAPMSHEHGTSISNGLIFVGPSFEGNGLAGERRVIDVSGDGPNNMGVPVNIARDPLIASGITINGLPIMIKRPGGFASIENLDIYYEDCVIGGTGAFLVPVTDIQKLASAIRRKLVLEIAARPAGLVKASDAKAAPRVDCMIGEKLREQWMRE